MMRTAAVSGDPATECDAAAPARNDLGRGESVAEREDRNLMELVQELRVAGLGVQVLFGFLLSLPFSVRFVQLSAAQRNLYVVSLLLAALATALLGGPVAYHRLVFRRHEKAQLLKAANVMAIGGIAAVGSAVSSAVALIASVVYSGAVVPGIAAMTFATFFGLWFVLPMVNRAPVPLGGGSAGAGAGAGAGRREPLLPSDVDI
jgi:hypothetical protein